MPALIVDTEYTTWPGALESGWAAKGQHREIVQLAAILVDDAMYEIGSLDLLVRPRINPGLSDLFTELTGIQQQDVDSRGVTFPRALSTLAAMAEEGSLPVVCMNADEAVLRENCAIWDVPFTFAASWHRLRPFLEEQGVDVQFLSSGDLHKLTERPLDGHTHNALHDVRSMACWMQDAARRGVLPGLHCLPTGAPVTDPRSTPRQ